MKKELTFSRTMNKEEIQCLALTLRFPTDKSMISYSDCWTPTSTKKAAGQWNMRSAMYEEYAIVRNFVENIFERVYYTKDDANDSLDY